MHKLENTREEILNTCPAIAVKLLQIDFAKGRQVYKTIDEFLKDIPVGILGELNFYFFKCHYFYSHLKR